jgi:hypothetical protein
MIEVEKDTFKYFVSYTNKLNVFVDTVMTLKGTDFISEGNLIAQIIGKKHFIKSQWYIQMLG